jgi:thiamine biosynthesis protein ThiI
LSLDQIASQTLEGLTATKDAATMPVLRALIGMDKQEIVDQARAIGTFELSQIPADDCCRFLMPHRVVTRPRLEEVLRAEASVDMDRLVEEALAEASVVEVEPRMAEVRE